MLQPIQQAPDVLDFEQMDPVMMAQLQAQLAEQQQRHGGNLPADANPLLLFLQTFLPWNRIQEGRGARREEQAGNNVPGDLPPGNPLWE
jgi:hypothetical protein